eukprot:4723822-Lingulodinium_polyedra.AAC.1
MPPAQVDGVCVLPLSVFREPGMVLSDMDYLPLTDMTEECSRSRPAPDTEGQEGEAKKRRK